MALLALETLLYVIATGFIVLAMAKERNERIHKTAATVDPLTGIANRRAVVANGNKVIKTFARPGRPVTALMFDLDFFKAINDRFGHAVGDRVLQVFASIATANLRSTDVVGRLGGEEFAAILPNMDIEGAFAAAERVRKAFEAAAVEIDGLPVRGSLSAGIAITTDSITTVDALLAIADEALYVAKARGRNRVEIAGQLSKTVELKEAVAQVAVAEISDEHSKAKHKGSIRTPSLTLVKRDSPADAAA